MLPVVLRLQKEELSLYEKYRDSLQAVSTCAAVACVN